MADNEEIEITRRDALKQIGIATIVAGGSIPVYGGVVSATESGSAELTLMGSIPSGTGVSVTIDEFDTASSGAAIASETNAISSAGTTTAFETLDAQAEYYYAFTIELTGDGSATPELESLRFVIPQNFELQNVTDEFEWEAKADSTIIEFDEEYLHNYQPMLRMDPETRAQHKGLYGYVARSEEQDTDVLCYWSQLTHQDGLPFVRADTHLGDHEPIYVFVNSEDGHVEEVIYSAYHWFKGSRRFGKSTDELKQSRTDKPAHATFSVVNEWHNYQFTPEKDGAFSELKSWPEVRETWIKNGFYEPANVAAIEDPWKIRDSDGWWRAGSLDGQVASVYARIGDILGWYGADEADDWR